LSVPLAEVEKGERSETRFFGAAAVRLHSTPQWLIGITRADIELDLRGVDAVAWVLYPKSTRVERIPIQIKSSWGGVAEHKKQHPDLARADVVYMVMEDDLDDNDIRRILYAELNRRRERNVRFERFLGRFLSTQLSGRAERRRQNYYASEMKDLRYAQDGAPSATVHEPAPSEFDAERSFWSRVARWMFPPTDDPEWKPWSWMIPSHW
jgi:hypothetical protein